MSKLIKAIFSGNRNQIGKLLESGDDINFQDKDKRTSLIPGQTHLDTLPIAVCEVFNRVIIFNEGEIGKQTNWEFMD